MSKERAKGTRAETAATGYLVEHGQPFAHRNPLYGSKDRGDIGGVAAFVLSVKDCKRTELATWVDEAEKQAANAHVPLFAVIHKRPRKSDPGSWYVTMPLSVFAELIR